jgi:hypothetical protein
MLSRLVGQLVLNDADAHPEEAVQAAHPLGVATGQVVVHGDDVNAFALERVQIRGQRGDEGLALARLHLGDLAAVEHHAANELYVEVPHVQHPTARLAHHREGLHEQGIERFALGDALPELDGLGAELVVRERCQLRFECPNRRDERPEALDLALVLRADDFGEYLAEHGANRGVVGRRRIFELV